MTSRHTGTRVLARQVVYYPDPSSDGYADLVRYTAAELAARRRRDQLLYARWAERQAAIAERDRRNRRILIGVLAGLTVVLVAGLALAAWFAYRTATATAESGGSWLGLAALGLLVLAGLAVGGHRCITVIEHRH